MDVNFESININFESNLILPR